MELAMQPRTLGAAGPHTMGLDAPDIATLQPLFPGYELQTLLGRGGMGFVYRARHRKLDRIVALKLLRADLHDDPAFAERFEREARALAMLDHPGIVGIHDFGQAGDYFYLVMDFVDGANLREVLTQGCLTTGDVLAFVPQLCDALQYAHNHRIVHRDIKPENILVDQDGRVHIADFGLAKLLGTEGSSFGLTQTHQALGTPHYMAPEQIAASGSVDHRADLYSLGVVLYEMLTGKLPIGRFQPPSAKASDARAFDPVVMRSLENDPDQRYQNASDVKAEVEAAGSGKPQEPPAAPPAPEGATHRRNQRPTRHGNPLRENPNWMMWHIWVGSICLVLVLVRQTWIAASIYVVFLGLSYFALPEEYRQPTNPSTPRALPWAQWLGAPLVLAAAFMPWATAYGSSLGALGMPASLREVRGTAFDCSILGVPAWTVLVLAFLITLLGTIRARGVAIPNGSILICSSLGTVLSGLFALSASTAEGAILGPGPVITLFVFFLWSTFELRRHGEASIARSRSRRSNTPQRP
jgi:serine/threonine protein kinase